MKIAELTEQNGIMLGLCSFAHCKYLLFELLDFERPDQQLIFFPRLKVWILKTKQVLKSAMAQIHEVYSRRRIER